MTQYRNRNADKKSKSILDLVHCDLAGPIDPVARENFRYAVSFVDDFSGLITVYFIKHKGACIDAIKRFISDVSPYGKIKRFRSDNGGEFVSNEVKSLLISNNIRQEFSAPYSPHQNGTVERSWRSLFEMARCLLIESNLSKSLWTYAVKIAAFIRNRCYNSRLKSTSYEIFFNNKPNLSNMHIFGSKCFCYVQNKSKLDARSEEGVFIGYDSYSPAYLVYFPNQNNVKRVRCVKFVNSSSNDKIDPLKSIIPEDEYFMIQRKILDNENENNREKENFQVTMKLI